MALTPQSEKISPNVFLFCFAEHDVTVKLTCDYLIGRVRKTRVMNFIIGPTSQ